MELFFILNRKCDWFQNSNQAKLSRSHSICFWQSHLSTRKTTGMSLVTQAFLLSIALRRLCTKCTKYWMDQIVTFCIATSCDNKVSSQLRNLNNQILSCVPKSSVAEGIVRFYWKHFSLLNLHYRHSERITSQIWKMS